MREKYTAALYMRLSKDDGVGESSSISAQRAMLKKFAAENGYTVFDEYVDDGVSGTTFDRPAFKRMVRDIEDKKVNMVITKDLSRLGRDYITTGQYTEIYFPSKNVRYIALNDGYDSDSPYCDIAPFKNVINEMYARDTSKKIRSALEVRMRAGEFVGAFAPYGYMRDPCDKHRLIVDEDSARIVRYIFSKAAAGVLPVDIARELNVKCISTPLQYRHTRQIYSSTSTAGGWTSQTITKMLRNVVYIGHMAQGKTAKVSFKSDVCMKRPRDEWLVVENTHEPIVSKETFNMASRRSSQHTCQKTGQFNNLFSGIAKCSDCGKNMSTVVSNKKGATANLACGGYKLYGRAACTNHFIDYDTLYSIVLSAVRELTANINEQDILEKVLHRKNTSQDTVKQKSKDLQKRKNELDILIEKLYEDYASGLISDEQKNRLLEKYSVETERIDTQMATIAESVDEQPNGKIRSCISDLIKTDKLNQDLLFRLIERIEVGQGEYFKIPNGRVKRQTVKIFFRCKKPENFFYTQK
ncbi:MAG: recombinase family protein [Clostridia bacterium]|nr:recombinase family protein [Clostridia bacterium]